MSPELVAKVEEVFKAFDTDGSKAIDREEAINPFTKGFAKISANEFFNAVDINKDGQVELEEFQYFWEVVKGCGHGEDEIGEELERIKNGESWVGFENLPAQFHQANKNI